MLKLIQNENMKIYRRVRTWAMVGMLVVLSIAITLIINSVEKPKDWRAQYEDNIKNYQNIINQNANENVIEKVEGNDDVKENGSGRGNQDYLYNEIALLQHALDHDIPPMYATMWGTVYNLSTLIMVVTLFTVIIAGDIVAGEFSTGTIKLLLIRPVSRSKILLSKYVSSFVFSLFLLIILFITSMIIGGILYGFGDFNTSLLSLDPEGKIVESHVLKEVLSTYGYACVQLVMIVSMAFMISTVFRSSSLAIGISLFLMMMGQTLTFALSRYEIVKYTLFANLDLSQYAEGSTPIIKGMSLPFSITVLIVYFIIFNVLSWTIFKKRDVAA